MSADFKFPDKKAVIYWPIGTGDSTTLILKPGSIVIQIDLRHLEKADDPLEPEWPIIDYLVKNLPKRGNGRPYLAVFALTHPDQDHVKGFPELLKRIDVGEIWHTPKIFRDVPTGEELCQDAKDFQKEVERRRKAILANPNNIKSGDRLRIIGHDEILLEEEFKGLPSDCKSRPGDKIEVVDGVSLNGHFQAFVHAPFKDDQAKDKNNTSLSLNIVIWEGQKYGQFLFLGDREYPSIKQIFEVTESTKGSAKDNTPYLYWDVMLSAHHCSKGVMYWDEKGAGEEFKKDIMDSFEKYSRNTDGYVIASSHSDFSDKEAKNPPHAKARKRYEEIVKSGHFICTHEYPTKESPSPIIFVIDETGFHLDELRKKGSSLSGLTSVVSTSRGSSQPPSSQTGFGCL